VGLDWLSPADIMRIDVLKYPAETSVYGPRGANGVILITTTRSR
jgi:TonB-dependent SusC/RagA subfamily outer membrane receptor